MTSICPFISEYLKPLFNEGHIQYVIRNTEVVEAARRYYSDNKENILAAWSRNGIDDKIISAIWDTSVEAIITPGFVAQYFEWFAVGMQLAYEKAPWNEAIRLEARGSLNAIGHYVCLGQKCVGFTYDAMANTAIMDGLGAGIEQPEPYGTITAPQLIARAGLEEGRHLSQAFFPDFVPLDPTLSGPIKAAVAKALVERVTKHDMTPEEKEHQNENHPMEIEAELFLKQQWQELNARLAAVEKAKESDIARGGV